MSSFRVVNKQILAHKVKRIDIYAPHVADKVQAGQFVRVCPEEDDNPIALTITSSDSDKGYISLIFHEDGQTTQKLDSLSINEDVFSVLGPLGLPATIEKMGVVVCVATGIGIAQILPVCVAFKEKGNKVIGIIGAKAKRSLVLEAQMRLACDKLFITTNDGSYERRGLATDVLRDLIDKQQINCVYAIGAVEMMDSVCQLTKKQRIKTLVKLNPVMVDCLGMCGACRVKVSGKVFLACVDGPEFDGHKVDFNDLAIRMKAFEESIKWDDQQSKRSLKKNESKTLMKFLSDILKS